MVSHLFYKGATMRPTAGTGIRLRKRVDLDVFGLAFLVEAGYFK